MKQKIEISLANATELKDNAKYLLILPVINNADEVTAALQKFLGDGPKVFVIAVKDVNAVKIAELVKENV
jgi:hypothetical protein